MNRSSADSAYGAFEGLLQSVLVDRLHEVVDEIEFERVAPWLGLAVTAMQRGGEENDRRKSNPFWFPRDKSKRMRFERNLCMRDFALVSVPASPMRLAGKAARMSRKS